MAVTVTCSTNALAADLELGRQQLRYQILSDGDLVFTLRSERDTTLLDDTAGPGARERVWPADESEVPAGTHVVHVLAVGFGQGGTLHWRVERLGADGAEVVKECSYSSGQPGEKFLDAFHVFVV